MAKAQVISIKCSTDDNDNCDERPVLQTRRLLIRGGRPTDRAAAVAVYGCPNVRRWWGTQAAEDVDEVLGLTRDGGETKLVIEYTAIKCIIGIIHFREEPSPKYRHAGIDICIHGEHQGKGFGPEAIRAVVDHLACRGHHRIVIDPNAENKHAISAYARIGFRTVGTLREYEWSEHLARWTDGILMELLISDLDIRTPAESRTHETWDNSRYNS